MNKHLLLALLTLVVCGSNLADTAAVGTPSPQDLAERVINDMERKHSSWVKDEAAVDIPILEKGTKDFPADSQIYYALAMCYGEQGDKQNMLKYMEKAYALSNKDPVIGMVYALSLTMNKQPTRAFEVDRELLAFHPSVVSDKFIA